MESCAPLVRDGFDTARPYDILCFGAHPDDVEMAMGGTVSALVADGARVGLVDMTRGELGTFGDATTREAEALAAAAVLGVDRRIYGHPDGGLRDELPTRHQIVDILRECQPSLVFAPWPHARTGALDGRANVDHLACGLAVREATKLARMRKLRPERPPHTVRRLVYYMVPDASVPSYMVDVSDRREQIVRAIQAYASQMEIRRGPRSALDMLMISREQWGSRISTRLAEAFISEDPLYGRASMLREI